MRPALTAHPPLSPTLLVLDAALQIACVSVVVGSAVVATQVSPPEHGQAARLAAIVGAVLDEAHVAATTLDGIAVTVGPGSFTGLRAALSVAHGIGLAVARPVIGVSLAEAFAHAFPTLGARVLWTVIDSRRGRVFLAIGTAPFLAYDAADLPTPVTPVAIAGDASVAVAARLAARGADVMLTDGRRPSPRAIAEAARARLSGALPPRDALPLYVDPPEARPPAGGLRPPPVA